MKVNYLYVIITTVIIIAVVMFKYDHTEDPFQGDQQQIRSSYLSARSLNIANVNENDSPTKMLSKNINSEKKADAKTERTTVTSVLYDKFYDKKKSENSFFWLIKNGINHSDATETLRDLRRSGGGWLYSIELIKMFNEQGPVSDINTSLILKIITDAYEGGSYADGDFSVAKNNKSIQIQDFLKLQLEAPQGKRSFYETLRNADILDQGDLLYQLVSGALDTHSSLLSEPESYKYKLKYSQYLPEQLEDNLKTINALSNEKREKLSSLVYKSIGDFSDNTLVVMNEEVKEQYRIFLNENRIEVPIYIDENEQEEVVFDSEEEMNDWIEKSRGDVSEHQQKSAMLIERLNAQMTLEKVTDSQQYLYQYALTTESIAELLVIMQNQIEESFLNDNNDGFSKFSRSYELKHKLETKLLDPLLTPPQKKEIESALDTYFDI